MTRAPRSPARLFVLYALASLLPVLVLGGVLAVSFRGETDRRGLDEGRSEAALIARTAIEPLLAARPLNQGLSGGERAAVSRLAARVIHGGEVLRMRLRGLDGQVVFSDDGSGQNGRPDDEALDAAQGTTVAELTRLNADANDTGRAGVQSVEVYVPLGAGQPTRQVGVLEIYLPYAPISHDVTAGLHRLYLELAIGLAALYLVLFGITVSVSNLLRREADFTAFLAEHDGLTELPNRALFQRRAAAAVTAASLTGTSTAIAIIDLDRFKVINDSLGHRNGDELIAELARRLSAQMRPGDTVARLGGDEFGLVLRDVEDARPALQRLRDVIDREIDVSGLPLTVQASIGFVTAPHDGAEVDELLQRADLAMYAAKERHAGVLRYDASLDQYDAGRLTLVSELRRAIDEDQLVLHYQPQVAFADGRVRAVEALIRWQHPVHGLLFPDAFLPLAEQTDLIDKLTTWVLRRALRDLPALTAVEPALSVAVNVSARTIGRASFAAEVIDALREFAVEGERLVVEVTETALLADRRRAGEVLGILAEAGVGTSLDDFGQGHTSLGHLSALPVDELKVDKGFVLGMLESRADAAIVRSIVDLGHNLGLRVVAEGVETEAMWAALAALGCDIAQGYLIARPIPLEALVAWLRSPRAVRSPA
jgi:diguanylate cyclase